MIFALRSCPPPWEITRAVSEGLSASLKSHVAQCSECKAVYEEELSLSSLVPALSKKPSSLERRQNTKQQLLQNISHTPPASIRSGTKWVALAATIALLLGSVYWLLPRATPTIQKPREEMRGVVIAQENALFTKEGAPGQERVALTQGKLHIEVKKLQPNERFIVTTKDAEVEVHGTRFEVFASAGELTSVDVFEGKVEVRYLNQPSVFLLPGEHWEKPTIEPSSKPLQPESQPSTTAAVEPTTEPKTSPSVSRPSPSEEAFADGFALMREKKFEEAALSFGKASKSKGSLQEDALFWQAIALGRAEKTSQARSALESFLLRYPSSLRTGEAALALGWILFDSKDVEGAKRWFHVAERDPSEAVKQQAQEALSEIINKE